MKILAISDTHGYHSKLNIDESVDVIVCTGDFSNARGARNVYESEEFLGWFNSLNIKHKILVAGNHDTDLERKYLASLKGEQTIEEYLKIKYPNITYLQDSSVVIDGIKFYGTPWCPMFYNWAFMENESVLRKKFSKIESDTNVLLTHTPAYGILDYANGNICGSNALLEKIKKLKKLKYHIFGHIHESGGTEAIGTKNKTKYVAINASMYDYLEMREPIVFEI